VFGSARIVVIRLVSHASRGSRCAEASAAMIITIAIANAPIEARFIRRSSVSGWPSNLESSPLLGPAYARAS